MAMGNGGNGYGVNGEAAIEYDETEAENSARRSGWGWRCEGMADTAMGNAGMARPSAEKTVEASGRKAFFIFFSHTRRGRNQNRTRVKVYPTVTKKR